jgi:dihydroorotate dehydrogenase
MNALDIISGFRIDGSIATNRTIDRSEVVSNYSRLAGGLSGKPLTSRMTCMVSMISHYAGCDLAIIGISGIMVASYAQAKLGAGF